MDDETLLQTIRTRWDEPREALEATNFELQEAKEELAALKLKVWEQFKHICRLQNGLASANISLKAADVTTLELCDTNVEVVGLESRVGELQDGMEEMKLASEEEITAAREQITALQAQNEELSSELRSSKDEAIEIKADLHAVKFELGVARIRAQTAITDSTTAKQELLETKVLIEESYCDINATAAQYEARLEALETELQLRNDTFDALQRQIQGEKQGYANLVRSTNDQLLEARSVSTDLLHSYLGTDHHKAQWKRREVPAIHLREHEWILSRVEELPENQAMQMVGTANVNLITSASRAPNRSATSDMELTVSGQEDQSKMCQPSGPAKPETSHGKDWRRLDGGDGNCVCTRCYKQNKDCTGGVQCGPCTEAGVKCTYKFCKFMADCRFPRCGYVHEGQEVLDGYQRTMTGERFSAKRRRIE